MTLMYKPVAKDMSTSLAQGGGGGVRTSAGALYIFYSFLYIAEGTLTEIFAHMNDKGTRKHLQHAQLVSAESHFNGIPQTCTHTQTHTQKNNNRSALAPDSDIR